MVNPDFYIPIPAQSNGNPMKFWKIPWFGVVLNPSTAPPAQRASASHPPRYCRPAPWRESWPAKTPGRIKWKWGNKNTKKCYETMDKLWIYKLYVKKHQKMEKHYFNRGTLLNFRQAQVWGKIVTANHGMNIQIQVYNIYIDIRGVPAPFLEEMAMGIVFCWDKNDG